MIFGKLFQDRPTGAGTVGELRAVLGHLEQLCVSAGANGPAKDLAALADALSSHSDRAVDAFCAAARTTLAEKPKVRKKVSSSDGIPAVNDPVIRDHVKQLRDAGTDRQAFDAAFARLKGDTAVKAPHVAEIARQYSLSVTKYKSIKAAQTDIEKAFLRQARFENKLR